MQEAFDRIKQLDPKAEPKTLSFASPVFTKLMEHQDIRERILIGRFTVPTGANWILPNPLPVRVKLFSAADTQIPRESRLVLAKRSSLGDKPEEIAQIQYAGRFSLSKAEQLNINFYHSILVPLFLPRIASQFQAIRFPEGEMLEIYVKLPVAVDLDQPDTRFEFPIGQIRLPFSDIIVGINATTSKR